MPIAVQEHLSSETIRTVHSRLADIEFVSRLKLIFERFRKHNLYIKASKCFSGYSELDFVGIVVSEKGLQISRTKIQSILDFPLPTVSEQLKSLLETIRPSLSHCTSF